MVSFPLPMGVETTVDSYQVVNYGFILLFFFPIVFGISVYSLSKYDEHFSNLLKEITTETEKSQLTTFSTPLAKEEIRNRSINNPLEDFVIDILGLIKGNFNQLKQINKTKSLLRYGAISLLAVGGTSLVVMDAIKNTSTSISPVKAKSVLDIQEIIKSPNINLQASCIKKIIYISSSLGTSKKLYNDNTYNPYRLLV